MKKRQILALLFFPVAALTVVGWLYLGEQVSYISVSRGNVLMERAEARKAPFSSYHSNRSRSVVTNSNFKVQHTRGILETVAGRGASDIEGGMVETTEAADRGLIPKARLENGELVQNESQIPQLTLSEAVQRKLMTVVSGYFEIPEMPHHPASYFRRSIPSTINWLKARNANVVYYHNLNLDTHPLGSVFRNSGMDLRKIELDDLPGAAVSDDLRKLCIRGERIGKRGNKCMYLHNRLNRHDSYVHILSVWFSKLPFVDGIIQENPYRSIYFGWFDCGIVKRLGNIVTRYKLRRSSIGTPRSGMHYGPQVLSVGHRMGLFAGPGHKMRRLASLHERKLANIFRENVTMCYDEEIVLAELLRDGNFSKETKGLVHYFR
eukprot:gb/GECG01001141.1/.p1 GENE.gb/GECG01001141.1/~~gb/GECG01001141.1/.p1  ORF type:complete len:378 (+),score=31.88 gb/GECG01001141.1/:1-1134(+)